MNSISLPNVKDILLTMVQGFYFMGGEREAGLVLTVMCYLKILSLKLMMENVCYFKLYRENVCYFK